MPVIGEYVVDALEGKVSDYTTIFKWREPTLEQIARMQTNTVSDERNWYNQELASSKDFEW